MIFIALGANLPSQYGAPLETLQAAGQALQKAGIQILSSSRIWLTAPVPFDADQDWYHNAVVSVKTDLTPDGLLTKMLGIEEEFGRVRSIKNAPRVLDLDLIAYHDEIIQEASRLIVPHPRMHERLFVLKPLVDIDNAWTHPETGQTVQKMIDLCDENQQAKALEDKVV